MESTADIEVGDVVAPRAAVSIEITSTPVLSYALAHNRVPGRLPAGDHQRRRPGARRATVRLAVRDAEGPIAQTVELLADLDEGRTTVLTDLGLVMDPAAMLHVEEQRPGVIDVEVEPTDGRAARRGQPRRPGARRPAVAGHSPAAGAGDARRVRACPTTRRSPRW